jgi:uncharacterized membrane protein YgcG
MNRWLMAILGAMAVSAAGCSDAGMPKDREVNVALVCSYNDIAITNAILVQHTLYPYHFVSDGAVLNELGAHDLKILAEHYRDYPGPLTVRQGDVPQALYEARLTYVRQALVDAGVAAERITVGEGPVGGEGATADRVMTVLDREKKNADKGSSYGSSTTPGTGGGSGGGISGGGSMP